MAKLLIFDLDGTLFDTAPGILTAVNRLLESRGASPISMESLVTYIGGGIADMIHDLDRQSVKSLGDLGKLENDFLPLYDEVFLKESHLFDGVLEFLRSWPDKLAILSNKKEKYVKALIEHTPLAEFNWQMALGGDSLETKKPDPEGINLIIEKSGVSSRETLMIGDGHPDIQVAKTAGVKSIAVDFGYSPIQELLSLGAHGQIGHFKELPKAIKNTMGR